MVNLKLFNSIYKNKKVLITGHTGFKGTWLTLWLLLLGAKVCGFSNNQITKPSLFNILKIRKKIKDCRGDIANYTKISKVVKDFQPEIIFHLAAQSLVRKSYINPLETFNTNSIGTLNILNASKESKKLKVIVMITSDKVYKNLETNKGYKEDDLIMGSDPYSASKSCAEIIINMFLKSFVEKKNINICVTRAGNVIGGGDWSKDRIVPDLFKQWANSKTLKVRSPRATRPWQFVLEPLGAYLYLGYLMLSSKKIKKIKKINFECFNVGPKKNVNKNVIELIKLIQKDVKNLNFKIVEEKSNKEAKLLKLNCNKIYSYTNWKPVYNFKETVKSTSSWYVNYYYKKKNILDFSINQIQIYINSAKSKKISWIK